MRRKKKEVLSEAVKVDQMEPSWQRMQYKVGRAAVVCTQAEAVHTERLNLLFPRATVI